MPLLETKGAASAQGFGLTLGGAERVFIEDVMSVFLYTGNGSTQTITNGIDLSTKGGLVWTKGRSSGAAYNHRLFDTARGTTAALETNTTAASQTFSGVTSFNSNGFTLGSNAGSNQNNETYVSWTFRKQPKFFDVVTYTGDGASAKTISHNLGSKPGCIIVKSYGPSGSLAWQVWHRGLSNEQTSFLYLHNTNAASTSSTVWGNTAPTSTTFTVGDGGVAETNLSGYTYVAYLFAHDAGGFGLSGTDNVISCGSYTGNGNATGPTVTLNYEPQWIMIKNASGTGNWNIFDNMRGLTVSGQNDAYLEANTADAEASANWVAPNATGFQITTTSSELNTNASTYIYIAIRRGPMRVPTSGTSVYDATAYTGNATVDTTVAGSASFPVDMVNLSDRDATSFNWTSNYAHYISDRLRGASEALSTAFTNSVTTGWSTYHSYSAPSNIGNWGLYGSLSGSDYFNKSGTQYIARKFRRAPGFFDVVCYTGTGSAATIPHSLNTTPNLMILKARSSSSWNWVVASDSAPGWGGSNWAYALSLNTSAALVNAGFGGNYLDAPPTASSFSVVSAMSSAGVTYVAYLFASCPGVSKVGSYTGTGATLQINCGFTGGARFVLIKRTDSTGDWYVWDSARGIVAGNDPYLLLNSTAAEVTTTDWVDTLSTGFELSNVGGNNVNINTATYIYLAIA